MKRQEFAKILCNYAKSYCPIASESIARNSHMNEYQGEDTPQAVIDALIVDFINFICAEQCMNLGFYTKDLGKTNGTRPN
jgi:hypothetical protein